METSRNLCVVRMSFSTMSEYSPNVPDVDNGVRKPRQLSTMYSVI